MTITPHLGFNGDARDAAHFYQNRLGARIVQIDTWGDSPMCDEIDPAWHDKIVHMELHLQGSVILGCDPPPSHYRKPQGISLAVEADSAQHAETLFDALADAGEIMMPLEETFFAARFGSLTDAFGIPWMIHCPRSQ